MDEKLINELLGALTRQRDAALNAAAQLEARLNMATQANEEHQKEIAEIKSELANLKVQVQGAAEADAKKA